MLVESMISIAFKNSFEQYNVKRISLFNIVNVDKYFAAINCKKINSRDVEIRVKCPVCNEYHVYNYNVNDFIKRTMVIGGCEKTGLPIFFIGKTEKVEEQVNKYKEIREKLYAMI